MASKNKQSFVSWNRLKSSFQYAASGIRQTWRSEQNFRIHTVFSLVVVLAAQWLNVPLIEQVLLLIVIGLVLGLELINTAIEHVVDLTVQSYDDRAKVIKDAAAGSVFVFSLLAVAVGTMIFLPRILAQIF
ncbi:diacylglycerol kinase family protein [Salisediminibacterium halotolerans]|uniref:Undecaprenol kinase n=1 Tax=Salisediminibacterium halotolerans TaxID=517425 RepID=A0A1H9S6P9_9BACI|nr:diacylglycerol kinase family protein [Salisediminibacterium haloalkalitolerans]SER80641.1 undecaprenol kinase [Salisediminibacterium haloalkalitolerans]